MNGVAIGMLAATLLRTGPYAFYIYKNVVKRSLVITPAGILGVAIDTVTEAV